MDTSLMMRLKNIVAYTKKLHILYVEDNEDARIQMMKMLENFFDSIDVGVDGEEGLERYKKLYEQEGRFYDFVISDINMPNMNGIDMSRAIIAMNPSQYILVVSAFNDRENFDSCLDIGVADYIHKPVEFDLLISAFDKLKATTQEPLESTEKAASCAEP
jgi:CheY-like chemotaxis protein